MEIIETDIVKKEMEPILSVKDWIIILLIMIIPIVNIIMLFVWAFGDGTVKTKSNFAKAQLVMMLIGIALSFLLVLFLISIGLFAGGFPNLYY